MDQISRPVLFALIAVVGFAAVWMVALRPKAETGGQATPPAAVAPAAPPSAVDKAQGAVAQSEASAAAAEAAAAGDQAPVVPAAPAGTAPAPKAEAAPKADTRTTVLLFAGSGADDAVARDVVRSVRGNGVRVIVASLADVAKYQDLLGDLEIAASPTILVIGKDRAAQRIEGLPDEAQVRQALRAAQ